METDRKREKREKQTDKENKDGDAEKSRIEMETGRK